jgi:polysaccharide export outer membrane protein
MTPAKSLLALTLTVLLASLGACGGGTPPLATDLGAPLVYKLSVGDKLSITVFGEAALSREYVVTSAGDISFPLLGDLRAAGRSLQDLSAEISEKLSHGYLNDPRVNIEVLNFRPIYVLGEVQKSGEFAFKPELTALQAIALAGGFSYRADKGQVYILRAGSDQELTYELDKGRAVYVLPGDTIRVGERYF